MALGRALLLLACAASAGGRGPVDAVADAAGDVAADSTAVAPDSLPQVDRILMPASRAADAISEKVAMFGRRISELRESQRRSLEHQKSQDEHELRAATERVRDEREKLAHLKQVIGQLKSSNDAKRECGRKLDAENEGLRERLRVLKERAASASEFAANSLKEADDSQSAVVAVVRAGEEVAADARELKVVTAQAEPAKPVAKASAKRGAVKPVVAQVVEKPTAKVATKATDAAAPAKAVSKSTVTATKSAAKSAPIIAAATTAPVKAGADTASAKVEKVQLVKVAEPAKPVSHEAGEAGAETSDGDEDSDEQQTASTASASSGDADEDEDYDSFVQLGQTAAMQEQLLLGADDELLDDALFDPAAAAAGAAVNSSDGHKLPWRRTADVEGSGMLHMLESDLAAMASQEQRSLAKLGALFQAKLSHLETEVSLLTNKEKKLSTQKAFLLGVARRLDRSLDSLEKTQAALHADLAQAGKFFDNLSHFAAGSIDAMDRP